tara:strand:+ start:3007 stop:4386 length:1380 start_codon:yes stop_codon:yes gene_type:complete
VTDISQLYKDRDLRPSNLAPNIDKLFHNLERELDKTHVYWSDEQTPTVDGLTASIVVEPQTPEEVALVLRLCRDNDAYVIPIGGGTKLAFGDIPSSYDVALRTTNLNKILQYEPADMTVSVEAGISLRDLQETLDRSGQFLPLDPPFKSLSTIGGIISTNAIGPQITGYGSARDMLIGTRAAHSNGELTQAGGMVVKNVTGYDLGKLYVGSLGTLGILTEANFKLQPKPELSSTITFEFTASSTAEQILSSLVYSTLQPESVGLLGPGSTSPMYQLSIRFSGRAEAVEQQLLSTQVIANNIDSLEAKFSGSDDETQINPWSHQDQLYEASVENGATLCRITVLPSQLAKLMNDIFNRSRNIHVEVEAWANAFNGILYVSFEAVNGSPLNKLVNTVTDIRHTVETLGGALVIESCGNTLKQQLSTWGESLDPNALNLMQLMRNKFDPTFTVNPGRFVTGV